MGDPVDVVTALGGAARAGEVLRVTSRRRVAAAVAAGDLTRAPGGVLAVPGASTAVLTAAVHNGLLTCASAAAHLGLAVLHQPVVPHVAVPRSRGSTPSGARAALPARLHRGVCPPRGYRPSAAVPIDGALARLLLCAPAAEALVTIDAALHAGRTSVARIHRALPANAPVGALLTLRAADCRSASPTETLARLALRRAGLPVEVAFPISGVGWVDLLVAGRVVVELDGFAYHSAGRQFSEDRRRDRELVARGFLVLRFTYHDVVRDPDCVVRAVRRALATLPPGRRQPLM